MLHEEQELVSYEAISYCWGTPVFDHTIDVNGRNVGITASLHGALQRFRLADEICYLWADALCINQRDAQEKGFQVRNIFSIFSKASTVLAYLGQEDYSIGAAKQILNEYANTQASNGGRGSSLQVVTEFDRAGYLTTDGIGGLVNLCRRPWVSRAWVQQEVFAAKQLKIICGSFRLSLNEYKAAGHLLRAIPEHILAVAREESTIVTDSLLSRNLWVLSQLRQATAIDVAELDKRRARAGKGGCYKRSPPRQRRCTRPECVLADLQGVLASDPRDRIYALLNLMDCQITDSMPALNATPASMILDYGLSTSQVFQTLTKYIINRDRSLRVLARHIPAKSEDVRLPSWTPDWRNWYWHVEQTFDAKDTSRDGLYTTALARQDYTRYDTLIVQGYVVARFASTPEGRQELSYHSQSSVSSNPKWAGAAELWTAADIVPGDIVCTELSQSRLNDKELPSYHRLEFVLRPRRWGGYYFVRRLEIHDRDNGETKSLLLTKTSQKDGEPTNEVFVIW